MIVYVLRFIHLQKSDFQVALEVVLVLLEYEIFVRVTHPLEL